MTSSGEAPRGDRAPRTLGDNVHGTRSPQSELSRLGLGVAGTEPNEAPYAKRGTSREVSRSLVRNWVPHKEIEHQGPWEVTCMVATRQPDLSLLGLGVALSVHPMPAPLVWYTTIQPRANTPASMGEKQVLYCRVDVRLHFGRTKKGTRRPTCRPRDSAGAG